MNRKETIDKIKQTQEIPVLIIGAGVNGVGTFRDLAAQGVETLIVEKDDFCSGASAASSHMLHGGIRYLENGEFRLVREALTERNLMLRNAPHAAKPLPTTVPIFKWFSGFLNAPLKFVGLMDKPAERGALVIKIGMTVYDFFARDYRVMPTHSFNNKKKSLQKHPKLNPDIIFTGMYYDSWMPSPERIVMDMMRDATDMSDTAYALNYVSAANAEGDTVTLRDEISGETFEVKPKVVINAGGPWIDFINKAMGETTHFIGGTKGSHLIIDNPELYEALSGSEMFFENDDGRIVLLLPYMGKVMAGTTDIRVDDPDDAWITDEETEYILSLIPKVFPNIKVERSQIVFHFSGVRPLPASEAGYTGNVSRDHEIHPLEPAKSGFSFPVYSLIGGKWTSFRAFSEETADVVLKDLNLPRKKSTQHIAIGGGHNYPEGDAAQARWIDRVANETGVDKDRVKTLFERYGTYAEAISKFIADGEDEAIRDLPHYSKREVQYLARREQVNRLIDIPLRRTVIGWLGELTDDAITDMADAVGEELGWSDERRNEEIARTAQIMNERYAGRLTVPAAATTS